MAACRSALRAASRHGGLSQADFLQEGWGNGSAGVERAWTLLSFDSLLALRQEPSAGRGRNGLWYGGLDHRGRRFRQTRRGASKPDLRLRARDLRGRDAPAPISVPPPPPRDRNPPSGRAARVHVYQRPSRWQLITERPEIASSPSGRIQAVDHARQKNGVAAFRIRFSAARYSFRANSS
jgi:hypothetical protein